MDTGTDTITVTSINTDTNITRTNHKFDSNPQILIPLISPPCPVCHSNDPIRIHRITYRSGRVLEKLEITDTPEIYLVKCKKCRHHFASPRLNEAFLDRYYTEINSEFYDFGNTESADNNNYNHPELIGKILRRKKGGKVLDIGCGYGFLLSKFDKNRWDRYGIEPSPHARNRSIENGLTVIPGYLDKRTFPPDFKFDVVILLDVLEHITNPNELIATIKHYLQEGGLLVIGTGNIRSLNARICQKNWAYLSIYEHISFYSPRSIRQLLRNQGFTCARVIPASYQSGLPANVIRLSKNTVLKMKYSLFPHYASRTLPVAMDHMIAFARSGH
jgi:SAM-dependent methyltransferase